MILSERVSGDFIYKKYLCKVIGIESRYIRDEEKGNFELSI